MTLRSAIRKFLRQLEADGRSPLTRKVYAGELDRFARWRGAATQISVIRLDDIARYMTGPALVGADGEPRSTRTVNRTRTVLRLLFAYLEDRGTLGKSPARLLRNTRVDPPLPLVLSREEEKRFVHALDVQAESRDAGRRDRVLFTLLLRSGMRLAAALALDVEHLDLDEGLASSCGKHGRVQAVVLPHPVVELLRSHLNATSVRSGPVFRATRGSRLSSRQAQYRFRALVELAGIDRPVTVHSLRHTFASRLRERTRDLRVVQAALGHRRLSTTETYAHIEPTRVVRAVVG